MLVIGGGAGGISAAQAAARRGATVLLVQDGPVGGDCTFTGCVPSKALLAAAASGAGFAGAMARVRQAVTTIAGNEDDDAMAEQGITVRHARATFAAPGVVDVDGTSVRARRTRRRWPQPVAHAPPGAGHAALRRPAHRREEADAPHAVDAAVSNP